ncbi:serine/threonine protein kinase, partial [bacterium]|nr:serine/threonine protein kinase [bacterium]
MELRSPVHRGRDGAILVMDPLELTPERIDRVEELFHVLTAMPPDERDQALLQHATDPVVRELLLRMLREPEPTLPSVDEWLSGLGFGDELPERIGEYDIVEMLGRGGMATVYRGYSSRLERDAAIKVPHVPGSGEADGADLAEARAVSRLNHPNVAVLYDAIEFEGRVCPVTEFLSGGTLRARLDGGRLETAEIRRVLLDVLEGLAAVHQAGIVHGDIKPENIGFDGNGRAKILDFGIARVDAPKTVTNGAHFTELAGTPAYMSPERQAGEGRTVAADIWSVGLVLNELLEAGAAGNGSARSGAGDNAERKRLGELVPRLLAFRPQDRPQTVREILELVRRGPKRSRVRSGVAMAALAIALVAAGAWAASDSGPRSAREWLRTIAGPRSIRPFATAFEIAPALVQPEPFRVL